MSHVQMAIDQMETIWGGSFVRARGSLGVKAFGLGVMQLPPNYDKIPHHVHLHDAQEEVYLPLKGSGWLDVAGERVAIDPDVAVRVGPDVSRAPISGPDGLQLLIVGSTPAKAYEPFALMEPGAPEPDPAELPGVTGAQGHESGDDWTVAKISEIEPMGAFEGVTFRQLRAALDATAFGINVVELADREGESDYPPHAHAEDGQTEVYVVTRGKGLLMVDGNSTEVSAGDMVAVEPQAERQWIAGDGGMAMVAIGAPEGAAYKPRSDPS